MFYDDTQKYETGELNYHQKNNFKKFLDKEIGTDFEVNDNGDNTYYIVIFDLTNEEVENIRDYENSLDQK